MEQTIQTKYPIVLVHGLFGFDKIKGYPYFYDIPERLRELGLTVFTPAVSAANKTEKRGKQLSSEISKILKKTKAKKVNLIGHCQGAPTCRYVAAESPKLVASVTSVNGANYGSEIADLVIDALDGKIIGDKATKIINLFLSFLGLFSTKPFLPQDFYEATKSLTTKETEEFNKKYPQGLPQTWGGEGKELESNGIYYYSWSGIINSKKILAEGLNNLDPSHTIMYALSKLFSNEKDQNDGFVGRFSSHLGQVIKSDYPMDHLDAINQIHGIHPNSLDPVQLYIDYVPWWKIMMWTCI